jgi:4-carboxy-4-hydroxy-2-oxoadipate aldolase/oxaloacetate decarboxylase
VPAYCCHAKTSGSFRPGAERLDSAQGFNPDLCTQFIGGKVTRTGHHQLLLESIHNVRTEHRLEAYATLTPSRRHRGCTARASGMALGDRSTVRKANVVKASSLPGDVIVIALSSENSDGMLGELLATSFRAQGAVGVIIDAGCRDVAELAKMGFPVWSKAVSAKGTVKATLGSVNVPVVCSGAVVYPGDAILADDDGVVTVPQSELETVVQAAQQREEREAKVRARLAAGELGLDVYNMRQKLAQLGLTYIDGSPSK